MAEPHDVRPDGMSYHQVSHTGPQRETRDNPSTSQTQVRHRWIPDTAFRELSHPDSHRRGGVPRWPSQVRDELGDGWDRAVSYPGYPGCLKSTILYKIRGGCSVSGFSKSDHYRELRRDRSPGVICTRTKTHQSTSDMTSVNPGGIFRKHPQLTSTVISDTPTVSSPDLSCSFNSNKPTVCLLEFRARRIHTGHALIPPNLVMKLNNPH